MSTENLNRPEDETSDPNVEEVVALDTDLSVPAPAPVLGEDGEPLGSEEVTEALVGTTGPQPLASASSEPVSDEGAHEADGAAAEDGGAPEAGTFPVGRPAEQPDPLAAPSSSLFDKAPDGLDADAEQTVAAPATVQRRSLFPDLSDTEDGDGADDTAPQEDVQDLPAAEPRQDLPTDDEAIPTTAASEDLTGPQAPDTWETELAQEPQETPTVATPAAVPASGTTRERRPEPTTASPAGTGAVGEAADSDEEMALAWKERRPRAPRTEDDILLEGSTVVGRPAPRTAAHWAGVLLSLVLLPVSWFFLHDSAAQALAATETHRFTLSVTAVVELAVGALALALALWTARRSSVGSFLVGVLTLLLGVPGLALPTLMNQHVSPVLDRLSTQSSLGADLASYVWADAATGRFVWLGLLLVMVGVVSHSARRAGRREQEVVDRVRKHAG